jgi:hypothetical protein
MAGSKLFYNLGKLFGEIGGQENIYRKNLPPSTVGQEVPISNLKAVPDDEVDPVRRVASSFKRVQNRQQVMSFVCCISIAIFVMLFLFLPE